MSFFTKVFRKAELYARQYGVLAMLHMLKAKTIVYIKRHLFKLGFVQDRAYSLWMKQNEPDAIELAAQRGEHFAYEPKVSIIVPLYLTPTQVLTDMIQSVLAQTYTNWELCLADGSGSEAALEPYLRFVLDQYPNIRYVLLEENQGIVGNSIAASQMATGEFIALLDHDDTLAPFALYEVVSVLNANQEADLIYSDEDKLSADGRKRFQPHFKPNWSPDTLRSYNYISHLCVLRAELFHRIGGFRVGYEGSQDYDLILRTSEKARHIIHIPKVLYHWRMSTSSTAQNPETKLYAYEAAKKALRDHLDRLDIKGTVDDGLFLGSYRVQYELPERPLVSIIIPNKDNLSDLRRCVESIERSLYSNIEIIIIENNSSQEETFAYYRSLEGKAGIHLVVYNHPFNFSALNNYAVSCAHGSVLLFLNNDIQVMNSDWMECMLQYALRPDVGAVGAKLYYPDGTIQHGGIILGIGGVAGHAHRTFSSMHEGYFGRLRVVQNMSAVTAACLMMRRDVYEQIGGYDESMAVAFNDVDLCLSVRRKGYLIVWTPYAELIHFESKTRGADNNLVKEQRFRGEIRRFQEKWGTSTADPYYNPNLTLQSEDFSVRV